MRARAPLASSVRCITEFANALGVKRRTTQLGAEQAKDVQLTAHDLLLLPVPAGSFHRAAALAIDASRGLRAGEALHLARAEHASAAAITTLDEAMARHAKTLKIKVVALQ